jgi:hypothetical protein
MDWGTLAAIAGVAGFVLTVCGFFGWNWRNVRYRALRFSEYPQITTETPATSAAIFAIHSAMATLLGFAIGGIFVAMAANLLLHPAMPYRGVTIVEMVIAAALMFWSAYRAGSALDRAYRTFFPKSLLDDQLQRRGHVMPDELRERRDAR